jgi:hypothetical protein
MEPGRDLDAELRRAWWGSGDTPPTDDNGGGCHSCLPTSSHVDPPPGVGYYSRDDDPDTDDTTTPLPGQGKTREDMSDTPGVGAVVDAVLGVTREGRLEEWQAMFLLARRLKGVPGYDPEVNSAPVLLFCHRLGIPAVAGWADFMSRWDAVAVPDGVNVLADAASLARSNPVRVAGCDPILTGPASLAFYLAGFTRPNPFVLSYGAVGGFACPEMPTSRDDGARRRQAGGRIIERLRKLRVVELVDANWRFNAKNPGENRAMTYRFTGTVEGRA